MVNTANNDDSSKTHLDLLLSRLNTKLLAECLKQKENCYYVLPVVESGCDWTTKKSSFNCAVRQTNPTMVQKPHRSSLEAACKLLYYGSDVICMDNSTVSLCFNHRFYWIRPLCSILMDYHEADDAIRRILPNTASYTPTNYEVMLELVKRGAEVNFVNKDDNSPLGYSICVTNNKSELFKSVWARTEPTFLKDLPVPLLEMYLCNCSFSNSEWLECLKLILTSPVASHLVHEVTSKSLCGFSLDPVLIKVVLICLRRNITRRDQSYLIYTLISLNTTASVHMDSIEVLYRFYGFKRELHSVIYCANLCSNNCYSNRSQHDYLISRFIAATKEDPNGYQVFLCFKRALLWKSERSTNYIGHLLGFFTLQPVMKRELISSVHELPAIMEKIEAMPKVASLVELSRNHARKFVRKSFQVTKSYQFYDAVEELNLPKVVKDILCFRRALY